MQYKQGGDTMKKKKIIAIITLILIVIVGLFIFKNITVENTVDEYQDYTPQEEISDEQLRQTKVTLYFANSETGALETEIRVIDANKLIENPCKVLMEMLIKGPESSNLVRLIPEGTLLHEITLESSCAVINVSNEILNCENEEIKLKMINSIMKTLENLKEVESIRFLINGEQSDQFSEVYAKEYN